MSDSVDASGTMTVAWNEVRKGMLIETETWGHHPLRVTAVDPPSASYVLPSCNVIHVTEERSREVYALVLMPPHDPATHPVKVLRMPPPDEDSRPELRDGLAAVLRKLVPNET